MYQPNNKKKTMGNETKKVKVLNQVWIDGITEYYPDEIDADNIVLVEDYPDAEETDYRVVGTNYGIPKTDCEEVVAGEVVEETISVSTTTGTPNTKSWMKEQEEKVLENLKKGEEEFFLGANMEEEIKNKYIPSDGFADELSIWRPAIKDGHYQFDKEKLERLSKMQKPTESEPSEKIEITVDGETYFINRKAWEMEQKFRKLRNQLFERQISQEEYNRLIEEL